VIPINNSDTAWLIVSDYNQENSIGFPEELREDILNPSTNLWIDGGSSEISTIGGSSYERVGAGLVIPGDHCRDVADGSGSNIGGIRMFVGQIGDVGIQAVPRTT
jgi:hypothetical protein